MNGRKWTLRGLTGTLALLSAAGGAWAQQQQQQPQQQPQQPQQQMAPNAPAATVNGEVITKGALDAQLKKIGPMPVPLPEAQRKQQQQMVLHALVDSVLWRQFLEKNAPPIDERELNNQMHHLASQLQQQGRSINDFCRDLNQTEAQVRANVATTFRWYAYADKHVTEQDVQRFYQENKDLFDQVRVRVSEILLRVPVQASPGERELARKRLVDLREKIAANQIAFEAAARQFSQSPSKDQGGDLNWIPHLKGGLLGGVMPDNIIEAAFKMQPGQVSDVLDSEYGLYLIKVTQRDPGHPSDFTAVKTEVHDLCVEEMKMNILNQQRKTADVKILLQ